MTKPSEININNERTTRLRKMAELQEQGINPYPARVKRLQILSQALNKAVGEAVSVAGRIILKREMGKLIFCHLQDESGRMQVVFKQDELGNENYKLFEKKIDLGDIIEVKGERFTTHKGEESILVKEWTLLTKALLPLPDKFHGLQDDELRYRRRYLDFLTNPEEKDKIITRANLVRYLREFLHDKNFVEIETPILETVSSGAMAKTFDTYLNAYSLPVHLRICIGELWQKRLLVGGFEKTFEIGRAFRNEGVDHQHNPEFTMLEFYWAFADYEDNIKLHEEMIPFVIEKAVGTLKIEHDGQKIDFTAPYPRITFHDAVLKHSGIDINKFADAESLKKEMKKKGYEIDPALKERGKVIDELYKQTTRPKLIQPTFVLNYPVELKPLAKKSADPRYTEMFQLIVNGFELSNSYTELNDPVDQRARFEAQAKNKAEGDEEAMAYDKDYVEALEYGMPPATGTGIGIDRFAALITGSHSLREIIAFPLMKPENLAEAGRSHNLQVAHVVLIDDPKKESWTKLNTVAHLCAAFGARTGKQLFHLEYSQSKDGDRIPMNIQHAIMIKTANSKKELLDLKKLAEEVGLQVECFTQPMQETSNDLKIKEIHADKKMADVEFLGVLLYGEKKEVEKLTKGFDLFK
jgi:lysyl-tRNA synthetase class 2